MKSLYLLSAIAALLPFTLAWLPHEAGITNLEGRDLFQTQLVNETESDPAKRWLPNKTPIRGVNLGSQFIIEPWMASTEWSSMGCGSSKSEFDCVTLLGQESADAAFANHWNSWITQSDIKKMASYSLNTIRIPLGYWIFEGIKYDSEHFPEGALNYLGDIVEWAADEGFYIVLNLHGAPFAQDAKQPFTGQYIPSISDSNPAFYQTSQYNRAYWFLGNLTHLVHTDNRYRNVGMIEVINEPIGSNDLTDSMRREYYPNAYATIRNVESSLGVSSNRALHIQMMDNAWGSGDPTQYLSNNWEAAYDDHNYIGFSPVSVVQADYLQAACNPRGGNWPLIVGEWSMVVANSAWPPQANVQFYKDFFARQARTYEKQLGWIYWTWKTDLNDPRWDYSAAVAAGIIPKNLDSMDANPC
ncbi:MAG: hypothetical protein GOMPHAMPRED_005357 [Gomphillus americanus]|uniref:glucan endo-1,6-beta-glucosidase n=1 Tax=Gomphillus americanus TaxID=1940652 RepID=A0A8H3FU01_9LECA|nr:MAG: hypothetical protein GOMPHAMPRED_005357 [Gomphillus americanus]